MRSSELPGPNFSPGSHIPIPFIEYTMPQQVDSQYDTNHVVTAYDGFSDFPDRPDNLLAVANAAIGAAIAHTPIGFTGPGDVPRRTSGPPSTHEALPRRRIWSP